MKKEFVNLKIPTHIAYIIDGNGRWAKERGLTRSMGHKAGLKSLRKIINSSVDLGIKYISIYAFSTENWNRPKSEIDYLFKLLRDYLIKDFANDCKLGIKLNVMGDYFAFPKDLSDACVKAIEATKNNTKAYLNLGINYGGRDEIIMAVNKAKALNMPITKENFSDLLYTFNQPDPDLIIRTSGEMRLSNFMLWQCAYSELYFPKTFWPDFDEKELLKALEEYSKRNRRFGAIKEE